MWFNRRTGRVGPLFQGRYKAILFEGRTEAWPVTRYVHLNPVRVKGLELGKGQRQVLKDYRWSSYPFYAGWQPVPEWVQVEGVLAGQQAGRVKTQRAAYRAYVESML